MFIGVVNAKKQVNFGYKINFSNRSANFDYRKNIKPKPDAFIKTTSTPVSFTGAPLKLAHNKILNYNLSAKNAIEIFENFKSGNYLDHGGDLANELYASIRKSNLEFLNHITNEAEKEKFIKYYSNLTGFPDLKKVAEKIENEFVKASEAASKKLFPFGGDDIKRNHYEILALGYDGVCSVGDSSALPGSDIDKAYIVLRGTGDLEKDIPIVRNFKGELWHNTDQRILSYNHDLFSFPKVYTKTQIRALIFFINKLCKESCVGISDGISRSNDRLNRGQYIRSAFEDANYHIMRKIPENFQEDYAKANKFLITLLNSVPKKGEWDSPILSNEKLYRETLYDFAFTLETMLFGKQFKVKNGTDVYWDVMSYFNPDIRVSDCLNTSQIRALKKGGHTKQKRRLRKEMASQFSEYNTNKQFEIIKEIIKGSANMNSNPEYVNLFSSNEPKRTVLLCRALGLPETK